LTGKSLRERDEKASVGGQKRGKSHLEQPVYAKRETVFTRKP